MHGTIVFISLLFCQGLVGWSLVIRILDYFTVSLHSPNGRHLPQTVQGDCLWLLTTVEILTDHVSPRFIATQGNTNLCSDQPITKGCCQPIVCHASYLTDSPSATRLGLRNSLPRHAIMSFPRLYIVSSELVHHEYWCKWPLSKVNNNQDETYQCAYDVYFRVFNAVVLCWWYFPKQIKRQDYIYKNEKRNHAFKNNQKCTGRISCFAWCRHDMETLSAHDDVIKWKHFPHNWPFVRGIHRSRWIPHTKASDAELWCLLWSASE